MAKKQAPIKIDHANQQIVLKREFAKKQEDVSSNEYKSLCAVVQMFPGYAITVKEITKNPQKESYKGLTYGYMERYIAVKGTRADRQEYDDMRLLAECHSKRFPVIKQWFLDKYPEVREYGAKAEFITPNAA